MKNLKNKLAMARFYQNPTNLHTVLIHLNRGNSCKNKSLVFVHKIFSQLLQLGIIQSDSIFNKLFIDI